MTDPVITPAEGSMPNAVVPEAADAPPAPMSTDDAIRKALSDGGISKPNGDGSDVRDEAEAKPEAKPEPKAEAKPKAEKDRGDDGKFKAKVADAKDEAPAKDTPAPKAAVPAPDRFNDGAKAEWDAAPEAVRHEVARMHRELEKGLSEYKAQAEEYRAKVEPLAEYFELAEKHGASLPDALKNYVAAEKALNENPVQALARMANSYVPGGIEAFMAHLTGRQAGNTTPETAILAEIKAENARLRAEMERLNKGFTEAQQAQSQAQHTATLRATLEQLSDQMPRLDELRPEMQRLIETGYVTGDTPSDVYLQAYAAADRLNPAPQPQPAPQVEPAQTRVTTSISGAPEGGSNPQRQAPASTDDAIWAAMRRHRVA